MIHMIWDAFACVVFFVCGCACHAHFKVFKIAVMGKRKRPHSLDETAASSQAPPKSNLFVCGRLPLFSMCALLLWLLLLLLLLLLLFYVAYRFLLLSGSYFDSSNYQDSGNRSKRGPRAQAQALGSQARPMGPFGPSPLWPHIGPFWTCV